MVGTDKIANDLFLAYQTKTPITTNPLIENHDIAYQIQSLMTRKLGKRIGWKVGVDAQGTFVRAPMFQRTLFQNHAEVKRSLFNRCLVESELAIIFKETMATKTFTIEQILHNILSINVGIEICDSRLQNWPNCEANLQLADSLTHGGYIIGSGVSAIQKPLNFDMLKHGDFSIQIGTENISPRFFLQNCREHPFKDISKIILWLVNDLISKNDTINAGDIITTGSFSGSTPIEQGEKTVVAFKDIGEAIVKFV